MIARVVKHLTRTKGGYSSSCAAVKNTFVCQYSLDILCGQGGVRTRSRPRPVESGRSRKVRHVEDTSR